MTVDDDEKGVGDDDHDVEDDYENEVFSLSRSATVAAVAVLQ